MSHLMKLLVVVTTFSALLAHAGVGRATPITSGLVYWLDANDLDGDGNAEGTGEAGYAGGLVTTWADKATGYVVGDGAQSATGNVGERPQLVLGSLNTRPVVRFDGIDDHLVSPAFASPLAQPNHVFMVWKADSSGGNASVAFDGLSAGNREAIVYEFLTVDRIGLFAGAGSLSSYHSTPFSDPVVLSAVFSNGAATMRLDGTTVFTGGTHGTDPLNGVTVGARFAASAGDWLSLDGYIAELLIYDGVLSNTDRDAVEAYLDFKWFNAESLPPPAPEPASLTLVGCAALALACKRRRTQRQG